MLDGGADYDLLFGGTGDDSLYSRDADLLDGGTGFDFAEIDRTGTTTGLNIDISNPARAQLLRDGTILRSIEQIRFLGGEGADTVRGGVSYDTIEGRGGADRLFGMDGNDWLDGGAGDDRLDGGAGNDSLIGGAGGNVLIGGSGDDDFNRSSFEFAGVDAIDGGEGFDMASLNLDDRTVSLVGDFTDATRIVRLADGTTVTGVEEFWIRTGSGADDIRLGAGDDVLRLGAGADVGFGGAGFDSLFGGGGADLLDGGADGDDLSGGSGDDRLIGGAGNDYLRGGSGADVFVFARGSGADVLEDFTSGQDRIDLTAYGVTFEQVMAAFVAGDEGVYIDLALLGGEAGDRIAYGFGVTPAALASDFLL